MDMYGRLLPYSKMEYLSDMNPYNGLIHQGEDMIPKDKLISTGVKPRISIIVNCVAIPQNDKHHPNVK